MLLIYFGTLTVALVLEQFPSDAKCLYLGVIREKYTIYKIISTMKT